MAFINWKWSERSRTHWLMTLDIHMPTKKLPFVTAVSAEMISSDLLRENKNHEIKVKSRDDECFNSAVTLFLNLTASLMSTVIPVELSAAVVVSMDKFMNHCLLHLVFQHHAITTHYDLNAIHQISIFIIEIHIQLREEN